MDDFIDFARSHGLVLDHIVADGRVHRCGTVDHPRKKNGAWSWDGTSGFVQDWANHVEAIPFRERRKNVAAPVRLPPVDTEAMRARAGKLACEIIARCSYLPHPYLARKGFPAEQGLVDTDGRLVVPMRDARRYDTVLSVQHIADDGSKRFLAGGTAKGAVYMVGSGEDVLCEGYATGLSVRAGMAKLYRQARVIVCFSAGNLVWVAQRFRNAFVVADHDISGTGEKAARETGLRWAMPEGVGDANDLHQAEGIGAVGDLIRRARAP